MEAPRPAPVSAPSWRQLDAPFSAAATVSDRHPTSSHSEPLKSDEYYRPSSAVPHVGVGDIKHEYGHMESSQSHHPLPASVGTPALNPPSLASSYSGPPPPYSSCYSSASTSTPAHHAQGPYASPPGSRRDSQEERPVPPPESQPRQALPSISEALGRLQGMSPRRQSSQLPISDLAPAALPPVSTSTSHTDHSTAFGGVSRANTDPYSSGPPRSYSPSQHRQVTYDSRNGRPHRTFSNGDILSSSVPHQRSSISSSSHNISPTEPLAAQQHMSPRQQSYTSIPQAVYYSSAVPSPQQGSNPPLSARSGNGSFPPFQHGQSQHVPHPQHQQAPAGYQQAPPPPPGAPYSFPPPQTSGLTYEESLQRAALSQQHRVWGPNPEFEKVEEQRRIAAISHAEHGSVPSNYAQTVKRYLDDFDVENNLNDLAERTNKIMDFAKQYGVKMHQYTRTAIPITELPRIDDCDRMIEQAMGVKTALERLRNAVDQQNRFAEQSAAQQDLAGKAVPGQTAFGVDAAAGTVMVGSDKGVDKTDIGPGGFSGGDAKKPRRGRSAQPGRCHSCNRVETPEWRRGPDGARTLCNACGLHYAKLTRKLQSGKDKTAPEAVPSEP